MENRTPLVSNLGQSSTSTRLDKSSEGILAEKTEMLAKVNFQMGYCTLS